MMENFIGKKEKWTNKGTDKQYVANSSIHGKKEKWTNKGTDKQYVANSSIHDTTYHTQCLYQISKSWVK